MRPRFAHGARHDGVSTGPHGHPGRNDANASGSARRAVTADENIAVAPVQGADRVDGRHERHGRHGGVKAQLRKLAGGHGYTSDRAEPTSDNRPVGFGKPAEPRAMVKRGLMMTRRAAPAAGKACNLEPALW